VADDKTIIQLRPAGGVPPGARLNEMYEIERLIGQGGMGEVYKGFNIQTHDPVAIKMILQELSDNPDVLALFRREATTLFKLYHEGIVRYLSFSKDSGLQRAYLAMEFVDGRSLAKRVAERPLNSQEARILVERIGSALDAAHRLGVVHRDISPDNIILPDDDVRKAKLIDFGIAKSHRPGEKTIIGDGFAGKYNYVSPEQAGLFGGEVTAKSDIYSFGLVLIEALRGRPLDMAGSPADVIEKRRRVPDLASAPPEFRLLLTKLLQPKPADRPDSIAASLALLGGTQKSNGSAALWAAAALIAVSLGAVGFVFRDDLIGHGPKAPPSSPPTSTPISTPSTPPSVNKPPPLPPVEPTASAQPTSSPQPTPTAEPTATPTPTPTPVPTLPSVEVLSDAAPPRAPQDKVSLPPAVVGVPYRAQLPAFIDPGQKGLKLTADATPAGLSFVDHGDGAGEVSGTPTQAGEAALTVTATNIHGRKARMAVAFVVGAGASPSPAPTTVRAPTPSQASVALSGAIAGRDYNATLPPFRAGSDIRGLTLRAEPSPPDGMTFSDAGGGFSLLSGRPTKAGAYAFDVVASDANGQSGRMTVKIAVAPAASETPAAPDKLTAFLRAYDGGACFFAVPASDPASVDAFAADRSAFSRFDDALKRATGVETNIAAHVLSNAQCPVIDLLKLPASVSAPAPSLRVDNVKVGPGRPLSGRVEGLAGRRLALISVDNDGDAYRLAVSLDADGSGGSFSAPLSGDAGSVNKTQVLLAIGTERPLPGLENFRAGGARDLAQALRGDWTKAGASASAVYFELSR